MILTFATDCIMESKLEREFHEAMMEVYTRALREARYNARRFRSMVAEHGGVETARYLLRAPTVSEGYTALWERMRLDLTVEYLILEPRWDELFSDEDRRIAIRRLRDYSFPGDLRDA